jgi:hypothetical protein
VAVTSGATKTPSKDWHAKSTSVTTATPVQFQAKELMVLFYVKIEINVSDSEKKEKRKFCFRATLDA